MHPLNDLSHSTISAKESKRMGILMKSSKFWHVSQLRPSESFHEENLKKKCFTIIHGITLIFGERITSSVTHVLGDQVSKNINALLCDYQSVVIVTLLAIHISQELPRK